MPHGPDEPGHGPHLKPVQLGVDPDALGDADPERVEDPAVIDALWEDATTVEEFAADILELMDDPPDVVDALRADRERRWS
jgi:hypothetical protein